MLNIEISENREFTKKLFTENTFDTFLLVEANVVSNVSYNIDGQINKAYFDTDELEALSSKEYITWEKARPHIYNVIKGKKLPLSFKIVLVLSDANIMRIIEKNNLPLTLNDIANLSLNIYFDGEKITVTTVATMKAFTLDKTLNTLWDENVKAFFKVNNIL